MNNELDHTWMMKHGTAMVDRLAPLEEFSVSDELIKEHMPLENYADPQAQKADIDAWELDTKMHMAMDKMDGACNAFTKKEFIKDPQILNSPYLNPNALLHIPGDEPLGPDYRLPIMQYIFRRHSVSKDQLIGYITKGRGALPDGLQFANGETVDDPNGWDEFTSPIYGSAMNYGWNMRALLAHPEINPNPDLKKIKFSDVSLQDNVVGTPYPELHDRRFSITGTTPANARDMTPLEMMCFHLYSQSVDGGLDVKPKYEDALHAHYIGCITGMLDAGAVLTSSARKSCEGVPELIEKIEAMNGRVDAIIADSRDLTARDLLQAYALGRMAEVLTHAQNDEQLAERMMDLRPELPRWLDDKCERGWEMLVRDWGSLVTTRRERDNERGGIG